MQQLQLNCDAKLLMSADSPLITAVKKDQVALWWTRYILRPLFSRLDQQSRSVLVVRYWKRTRVIFILVSSSAFY